MTVRLPVEKKEAVLKVCLSISKRSHNNIRELFRLIGKQVTTKLGVEYAQLRYKPLERIKDKQFKLNNGNFDSTLIISRSYQSHIRYWIGNLVGSYKLICNGKPNRGNLH